MLFVAVKLPLRKDFHRLCSCLVKCDQLMNIETPNSGVILDKDTKLKSSIMIKRKELCSNLSSTVSVMGHSLYGLKIPFE